MDLVSWLVIYKRICPYVSHEGRHSENTDVVVLYFGVRQR